MVKKTYRTYSLKSLSFDLELEDGNQVEVLFRSGIQIDSTAKFTTSNEEVQQLLESRSGFERDYYLESVRETEEAKPVEVVEPKAETKKVLTDVKDIKRFKNLVEMRSYMAEIGIEGVSEMNYMQAKAAAAKEGYDFQISRA